METTVKRQRAKVGGAGLFQNQLMANNSTEPVVGQGATQMHYTDRTCYEVIEVSANGKSAKLERLEAEAVKPCSHGHQNWILKPTGHFITVVWKWEAWRTVGREVVFTPEFLKEMDSKGVKFTGMWLRKNNPELADKIYGDHVMPINEIEGITKAKATYSPIKLLFGVKDYYYDWSF